MKLNIFKFIKNKVNSFLFIILRKSFSILGLNFEKVDYSDWTSSIYLLYRGSKYNSKNTSIKKVNYFKFNVFYQPSDLRAVFKNYWDDESTRIAALFSLNRLLYKYDFYDLGANYGLYSLPFSKSSKVDSLVVVEANPFLIPCLKKTFLTSKAKVISCAITDSNLKDELLFNIKPFASGASSLETPLKHPPLSTLQVGVEGLSYSRMFEKYKVAKQAIIKIDIEGSELSLLKDGFLDCLKRTYDDFIIMIEYIPKFYSKGEIDTFASYFSEFYTLPLTNLNFRNLSEFKDNEKDFLLNENSINRFYKTSYGKGIDWFANDKKLLYSDIIVFSSEKLAKEASKLL